MISNSKASICCECAHAKRRFFTWFCTCPELIEDSRDVITGKVCKHMTSCQDARVWRFCPQFEPRQFAPPIPEERRNPIPPLPPRSFVPPKETPMHKAPPMENEIGGCDSCKWHQPGVFNGLVMYHACKHKKSRWDGRYNRQCIDMRSNEDFCGKEKRLYKPKDQAK